MRSCMCLTIAFAAILGLVADLRADVPHQMNFQGRLYDTAGQPVDTVLSITFCLYADSTGGTPFWSEVQPVDVDSGFYNVILGSITEIPDSAFQGGARWLGVRVGEDSEMAPRVALVSVAYAFRTSRSDTAAYASVAAPDDDWVIQSDNIYRVAGNVGVGTPDPAGKLHVAGNALVLDNNGANFGVYGASDAIEHNHFLQLMNSTGLGSAWGLKAGGLLVSDSYGYANPAKTDLVVKGRVGVGKASPAYSLDVSGTVNTTGFRMSTGAFNGYVLTSDASGVGTWQAAGNIGGGGTSSYVCKFTSTTAIGNSAIYETSGNVGIGTTSPAAPLDIQTGSGYELRFSGTSGANIYCPDASMHLLSGVDLHLGSGGTNYRMTIDSSGNVGVGTTSPGDKLDVNGDIRVRGADIKDAGGTARITLTDGGALQLKEDGGVAALSIDAGGDVGIGTTTPSRSLDVSGLAKVSASYSGSVLSVTNTGSGPGIYATTQATRNDSAAVFAEANEDGGCGVFGSTSSLGKAGTGAGSSVGVFGRASGTGGSIGGAAFGVFGRCASYQGSGSLPAGIMGEASVTSGKSAGVIGESKSQTSPSPGVYGVNSHTTGSGRGVWGEVHSPNAVAVFGRNESSGAGTTAGNFQNAAGTWTKIAYWNGSDHYGIQTNGLISSAVAGSGLSRTLYASQSPEVWSEDFGADWLKSGRAHVELDPAFLEVVTVDQDVPMKVFIQLGGDCQGVYVVKGSTGFDVVELQNGKSDVPFDWRVVAKRKGYEHARFEPVETPIE